MKTMTCKQLGGVCDKEFCADTFEEIVEQIKKHGMNMYLIGDAKHVKVIKEMRELMEDPDAMDKWMKEKRKEFDALPEDR